MRVIRREDLESAGLTIGEEMARLDLDKDAGGHGSYPRGERGAVKEEPTKDVGIDKKDVGTDTKDPKGNDPKDIGGRQNTLLPFKDAGGFEHTGITWKQPVDKAGRPIPIKVGSVEEGVLLVQQGKVVEVKDAGTAHTLITRLAEVAAERAAQGRDAQDYDLCQVSVAGSNLFCAESIRNEKYPKGIGRLEMPQLGGKPVPGSEADTLPRNPWDPKEVDGAAHFMSYLQGIGVSTQRDEVPAANLRASQRELVGSIVSKMINDTTFQPGKNPIFVSRDGYIVDGHHRWAAVLGRDLMDGKLGDDKINVVRVNAPISEVLHLANAWSARFGIQQRPGVAAQAAATGLRK